MNEFNFFGMPADYAFQLTNLLFLLIPLGKAYIAVFLFQKKNIPVKHKKHLAIAIGVGLVFALVDWLVSPVQYLFQPMVLATGYFFLLFDPVRNVMAGKPVLYVDSNPASDAAEDSWWDRVVYARIPPHALIFLRLFAMIAAMSVYYLWSELSYGWTIN